tara:strand:- start:356 stop:565 length:210 start_codon:yes stop_codon:yes gene_type:complete
MDALTHTLIAVGSIAIAYYTGRWVQIRAYQQRQFEALITALLQNHQPEKEDKQLDLFVDRSGNDANINE